MPNTILVVEDSTLIALDLVSALEDAGYVVVGIAATTHSALALAEEHHIDLATMDIELTRGSNGIETAISLREKYQIPPLFVSGSLDEDVQRAAGIADPIGFIHKPVSADAVVAAVKAYLSRL